MTTAQPTMDLPECPVCLETYNDTVSIPRVLSCGHSICEACLVSLPQRYPNTIRCPACTQLLKYPSDQGPSSLPKNIDLLRISLQHSPPSSESVHSKKQNQRSTINGVKFWSDEFYATWKDWILPHDAVLVEPEPKPGVFVRFGSLNYSTVCFRSDNNGNSLSLVPVVSLPSIVNDSKFRFSYVARIIKCLERMKEVEREGLILILEASERRRRRMCRVYGLWSEVEEVDDAALYIVCERHNGSNLFGKFVDLRNGFLDGGFFSFAMIGKGICESVLALHLEGLVAGCLGLSCFYFDEFGGVCIDLNEALVMGRRVCSNVVDTVSGATSSKHKENKAICKDWLQSKVFVSPEVLFRLLHKDDITCENGHSRYPIGCGSDIWSLACVLLLLLVGHAFPQYTFQMNEENGFDYSDGYACWLEEVNSVIEDKLGPHYLSLRQTLCKCLDINPGNRPDVVDVRKCIQDMLVIPQFDFLGNLEVTINKNIMNHCFILGELFQFHREGSNEQREYELQDNEDGGQPDFVGDGEDNRNEDFVAGLSKGMTEFNDLRGHLDCITGLAVGGGYLFSSSFDKTVCVWSLQDFSHLHTFRGHEDKVMALVCVDEEEPLCISGDSGGGIFVWGITSPLRQVPLRKWYEHKDWRFSGIHSLTAYRNHYLYTGSGDRTIKAWSLKDGSLICTMNGHSSVVSKLAICDEVLYSGSWDGTVRLWSLYDHSPLTVLGEDMPREVKSVLAITVNRQLLVAGYENGCIKVWSNDVFMNSKTLHDGAIFAMDMRGKCLYTGGWDKTVNIQELSGDDEFELDVKAFGSIPCSSVVTAILCCQGKLFVGYSDKSIKVYHDK
ncbi:putative [Myosin heavy-chain] kinase transcription factor WD40-like family [Lupinus albus]|uniref:Putative [Myosin heavy-chain] kinase transcription factor WD40-like family n=1 Tax=Lupinus albus TaxID=3870 RepID=A0A6A4Q617_LUPAL|nr:putative [Myosin heavy-chain] kinase transcription factor WD40-like family [Lupinus albus]